MALISNLTTPNNETFDIRAGAIPYGTVDSTSTATVFTATVPGITALTDGTTVMLKNGVVTSTTNFTINVNGLGAKPVYNNMAAATRDTTIFNVNYTMLFVYDEDRVSGGCWICYRGYDANTNTIGYQVRTNSSTLPAVQKGYRYRLWLTSADGQGLVPINTSTATDATAARTLNTTPIDPFGAILYYSTNGTTNANANLTAAALWQQYTLTIGYSYVKTLTFPDPVYLKCTPQSNGSAVMKDIVQALPTTEDGYIYIFLGRAYSATAMELMLEHPVYYYKDGAIRLWTNAAEGLTSIDWDDITDKPTFATVATSGSYNDLSNKPTIPTVPTKTSDLTNDSGFITASGAPVQSVNGQTGAVSITIPTVPSASTTTPSMDGTASYGSGTTWARADHVHPTDTSRQASITGAATTITSSNLTASRALISNSSGKIAVSDVTSTELGYLDGVTSAIQTQLDGKQASGNYKTTQTAVSDPTYDGTALTFISNITQNANGVITPLKKAIASASAESNGIVTIGAQTFAGAKTFTDSVTTGASSDAEERYVRAYTNSGTVSLRSLGNADGNGNRGIYVGAHGTASEGKWMIYADTNSNVYLPSHILFTDQALTCNNLGAPNIGGYGTALQSGDNVDTDLEMGKTYYSASSTISAALAGTPPSTTTGFKIMQIRSYGPEIYYYQIAFGAFAEPKIRYKGASSAAWTEWSNFLTTRNTVAIANGGTGQTGTTTASSGILTRSSGASISGQLAAKWGKMVTVSFDFNYTSQVSANGTFFKGTIASGYRPAIAMNAIAIPYNKNIVMEATITTAGVITITPSATLASNTPVTVTATYIIP